MPVSISEIKDVVLRDDDFGHEMRVGGILTNIKYPPPPHQPALVLPPSHGGTYTDQVTGKTRQFDYRCQITNRYDRSRNIYLAVECKNLNPDLPLVICGRPRTDKESYLVFIATGDDKKSKLALVSDASSLYPSRSFVGKSILRLKKKEGKLCSDGDSDIYDKWSQALASSHDLAYGAVVSNPIPKSRSFILPLVVVPDNSLWRVGYTDDGRLESDPTQAEQCEFYVDQKLRIGLPFVITHIHFITLKGLSQMLSEFANADSYKWERIFCIAASEFNPV